MDKFHRPGRNSQATNDKKDFVPRTVCPNGHDLSEHGYPFLGAMRCRICATGHLAKISKTGLDSRWKKLRESKKK